MSRTLSSGTAPANQILQFYHNTDPRPDFCGRKLRSILRWSDDRLEAVHNYIQILFPLPEASPINPAASTITEAVFNAFRSGDEEAEGLQAGLRLAFARIAGFFGFKVLGMNHEGYIEDDAEIALALAENCEERFSNWVVPFSHNHLRITRIIRCLRVLGLEKEASAFHSMVKAQRNTTKYGGKISTRSIMYWDRAAERPLWMAPEHSEQQAIGQPFLIRYEQQLASAEPNE